MIRFLAHLLWSILAAVVVFVLTFLIAMVVQVAIYGGQAFEHDAGASFAVSALAIFVAILFAIATFASIFEMFRDRRLATPALAQWSWACWRESKSPPGES